MLLIYTEPVVLSLTNRFGDMTLMSMHPKYEPTRPLTNYGGRGIL